MCLVLFIMRNLFWAWRCPWHYYNFQYYLMGFFSCSTSQKSMWNWETAILGIYYFDHFFSTCVYTPLLPDRRKKVKSLSLKSLQILCVLWFSLKVLSWVSGCSAKVVDMKWLAILEFKHNCSFLLFLGLSNLDIWSFLEELLGDAHPT